MRASPLLEDAHGDVLVGIASGAIRDRVGGQGEVSEDPSPLPAPLAAPGASFVTVMVDGRLQGCIGTLRPRRALAQDVRHNARGAAFSDPRFAPLGEEDLDAGTLEVAVLGALTPMAVSSEAQLLAELRPGVDGLLLELGPRRATFLPKVWQTLPEPRDFLDRLLQKMGCTRADWSAGMRVERYVTQEFRGPL